MTFACRSPSSQRKRRNPALARPLDRLTRIRARASLYRPPETGVGAGFGGSMRLHCDAAVMNGVQNAGLRYVANFFQNSAFFSLTLRRVPPYIRLNNDSGTAAGDEDLRS